ncbi:uncharacterized protein LOC108091467 isoform X2 [Drosophila ficusphila]|uniref:uncharacterized protein LOC108091467 isoform X2 n=1 Tax=Drosophila ficusphila TaxID=30025 RepID=UPI0007E60655|nr:uncharacterized protein LOC108091467 isoform X2 [Drosophila ficusphila]
MKRLQDAKSQGSRKSLGSQSSLAESECQEPDPLNTFAEEPLSMYQWMRWKNCKTQKVHLQETYPIIRPPVSKCYEKETLAFVDDAMEANQCKRLSDLGKPDVVTVWNSTPRKDTLGWYGIDASYPTPEAASYDRALQKSLEASSLLPKPPKKSYIKPEWVLKDKKKPEPGAYVLNRPCLKGKLDRMPNVRRQLRPINALSWLHCPDPPDPEHPFENDAGHPEISMEQAMDMAKPVKPPKHGLRRKHWYCPPKCGEEENRCTDFAWALYKLDPRPYDEAFERELAGLQAAKDPEPSNYDELYKSLITCFERDPNGPIDLCEALNKCCKHPGEPPSQGCGEFVPDGPGGGEGCGCCGKCCCRRKKAGESCEDRPIEKPTDELDSEESRDLSKVASCKGLNEAKPKEVSEEATKE